MKTYVQIDNCIYPNCEVCLSKMQNVFVQILDGMCPFKSAQAGILQKLLFHMLRNMTKDILPCFSKYTPHIHVLISIILICNSPKIHDG